MIGHYLLTLTPQEEDSALTTVMRPWPDSATWNAGPCLVQATDPMSGCLIAWPLWNDHDKATWPPYGVGTVYDALCHRFGEARINATIRTRILANRARRVLGAPVENAVVGSAA